MERMYLTLVLIVFLSLVSVIDAVAEIPTDIAIAIDTSGSMKSIGAEVKRALSDFLEGLPLGSHVVLVQFDVFADTIANLELEDERDKSSLVDQLRGIEFRGPKTNFDEAIKGAESGLFRAGITGNATVVIFSDGISDPSATKPVVNLTDLAKQVFPQGSGYSIYLVGVTAEAQASTDYAADDHVAVVEVTTAGVRSVLERIQEESAQRIREHEGVDTPVAVDDENLESAPHSRRGLYHSWLVYPLMVLMVCGIAYLVWYSRRYFGWLFGASRSRSIAIQLYGREETRREFWLRRSESIQIGPGICAYPVNAKSTVNVTIAEGDLLASPSTESDNVSVNGDGISAATPLASGDIVALDGYLKFLITW